MTIIEATSGTFRSRVDGTIVLSVEIDPRFAREAMALFGMPGTSMALAALKDGHAAVKEPQDKPKPGPLCREAIDLCARSDFWQWLRVSGLACQSESDAKECVLAMCDVGSRKDLDAVATAGEKFVVLVRVPFMKWLRNRSNRK